MIASPPKHRALYPFLNKEMTSEDLREYLKLHSPTDEKGRYLHFHDFRYRVAKGLNVEFAWSVVKSARNRQLASLFSIGEPAQICKYMLTATIHKAISETDRNTTRAALEWMSRKIGEEKHIEYLLNDLIEDEAISSSQLEGAATTTKIAKDLLKRKRKPRTSDEKMIVGNYIMMQYAWENRHKDLSPDFISQLHQVGVDDIDNDRYHPGAFRNSDDIVIVDGEGNTVHQPPNFKKIEQRLKILSNWVNHCHHDTDSSEYIHPLLKAIVLHFSIGYEHPFRDGNGRVARALFYWYLFKNDYAAFRYIAISILLKLAPIQYGKSYLYTETDEMDMTYFIEYQCKIILRSISNYKEKYQRTLKEIEAFNQWLWESGLYKKLNANQRVVFQIARSGITPDFTTTTVKENLGCSYNTAAQVLKGLVSMGLFKKKKAGREWIFTILPKEKIMKSW